MIASVLLGQPPRAAFHVVNKRPVSAPEDGFHWISMSRTCAAQLPGQAELELGFDTVVGWRCVS